MTISLILLLAALAVVSVYMVVVGDSRDSVGLSFAGVVLAAAVFATAMAIFVPVPGPPSCHLSPASLAAEKMP